MRKREKEFLSKLKLDIQVSTDGGRIEADIASIQNGAKQHVIIVAGERKAIKDALLGANLLKLDFAMSNVLVVPYLINDKTRPDGTGFARPIWETQPYVATPVGENWNDYIDLEFQDAAAQYQGKKDLKEEGIAIVMANNGQVVRRGIGKVPWRQMVEELQEIVAPDKKEEDIDIFL